MEQPAYLKEHVRFLTVRFGNGEPDTLRLEDGDVVSATDTRLYLTAGDDTYEWDRGGAGVVHYRVVWNHTLKMVDPNGAGKLGTNVAGIPNVAATSSSTL